LPKSSLDWLAVVSLWLGAALFAIRSANLQAMKGAPSIVTSELWNYAPLALLSVALVLMAWRAIRGGRAPTELGHAPRPGPPSLSEDSYMFLQVMRGLGIFALLAAIILMIAAHWPLPK